MELVLLLVALVGHAFLWASVFNHTHGSALPRWIVNPATVLGLAGAVLIPVAFAAWLARNGLAAALLGPWTPAAWVGRLYLGVCWVAGPTIIARWGWHRLFRRPPALLRHDRSRLLDLVRPSRRRQLAPGDSPGANSPATEGGPPETDHEHHFLVHLPGNEMLQLDVAERALEVPGLATALDRLTIVHMSDLHLTGRVGKGYFDEVVRLSNQIEPDLVAITGDLVDRSKCIDWIPDTLGKLTSRSGVYFVLGNHDLRIDPDRLRRTLTDSGLVYLGSRWTEVRIRGEPVVLAGNELPWIAPAANLEQAPPPSREGGPLRIALAHSPDQIEWARAHHFDLLLAGHTHGGQIRLPLIGPILSASRRGVRYSSGIFHDPPTIMHVTRGVSGKFPIRINCPPEMAKLVLRTTS